MAILNKQTENVNEALNNEVIEQKDVQLVANSIPSIIKAISWPSFGTACKYAGKSLLASAVIGALLYGYGACISAIIALII